MGENGAKRVVTGGSTIATRFSTLFFFFFFFFPAPSLNPFLGSPPTWHPRP